MYAQKYCQITKVFYESVTFSPQVAKRSDIRLGSAIHPSHAPRSTSANHIHVESSPLHASSRSQYLYSSQYHTPLIENSSELIRNDILYDADRPGTPALRDQECIERCEQGYGEPDIPRYSNRYGQAMDRGVPGKSLLHLFMKNVNILK